MDVVISNIAKENIITVYVPYEIPVNDRRNLLQQPIVMRTDSESRLNDLVAELLLVLPSYSTVLKKGHLIDSLMLQVYVSNKCKHICWVL